MKITSFSTLLALSASSLPRASAYWLMGIKNFITTERLDPIVNPGAVSGHVHSVVGGSNFGFTASTASLLKSDCTSIPIKEDKSNYWFPHLYFQWRNGSFSSVDGGAVIYYLFDDKPGTTTAFPPDFRMISGSPTLRTYDANSYAQQAVDFLCLDFSGQTTKHTSLPEKRCPSGIRSQINFPSCWDGKNVDSPSHKSHVAFRSGGPDKGKCTDPNFPVELPRIFLEVYWGSANFDSIRDQAMNPNQPFVFAHGDPTGYGNHADFFNGWEPGVLQRAVDGCTCNIYGDPTCCAQKGLFTLEKDTKCYITKSIDEQTTGTLPQLPGNNPVQPAGTPAKMYQADTTPGIIAPVYAYTSKPTATGQVVIPPSTAAPTIVAPPPPDSTPSTVLPPVPTSTSSNAPPSSAVTTSSTAVSVAPSASVPILTPILSSIVSAAPISSTSISAAPDTSAAGGTSTISSSAVSVTPPAGITVISSLISSAVIISSIAAPPPPPPPTTSSTLPQGPRTTYTHTYALPTATTRAAQVTRSTAPPYAVPTPTPINAGGPGKTCKKKHYEKHFSKGHHYRKRQRLSFDFEEGVF